MVYKNQEGLYKYLQTISIYLVMPITPGNRLWHFEQAGEYERRGGFGGRGDADSELFVADQLMEMMSKGPGKPRSRSFIAIGRETTRIAVCGERFCVTAVLFGVSCMTKRPRPEQLATTTVNWDEKWESFEGITDWRLHLFALSIATVLCYWWLW